ncbi:hypothetical protein QBC39DRAFT_372760 [Podospora conica]|nr:hypothetical protein QBC39DRAFT_372760 [Schizothecium conicum]
MPPPPGLSAPKPSTGSSVLPGRKNPNLLGRSIIITGGAGEVGMALAHHFADRGHNVALLDNNTVAGANAELTLRHQYPEAYISYIHCDVSDWTSQALAFKRVYVKHGGNIDLVVANAGITQGALVDFDEVEPLPPSFRTLDVNLWGVVCTVKLAAHYMNKSPAHSQSFHKSIICMSSCAGLHPMPMAPLYSASKFGIIGLARSMYEVLGEKGIQINALAPGFLETSIRTLPEALSNKMIKTPMSSVVRAVKMVLAAPTMTGEVVKVNEMIIEVASFDVGPERLEIETNLNVFRQATQMMAAMKLTGKMEMATERSMEDQGLERAKENHGPATEKRNEGATEKSMEDQKLDIAMQRAM